MKSKLPMLPQLELPPADYVQYYQPFADTFKSKNGISAESGYSSSSNAGKNNDGTNGKGSGRLIRYSTRTPLDEKFRNGLNKKPYVMHHHKFHPHGFHLLDPSKTGLQPLSALRIMQSRLKDVAIKSQLTEREIKADFCQSAVVLLEQAEKEVELLERKRSDALIFGEQQLEKELSRQIRDKFDRVLFSTYADLLLRSDEVKAFGIESKWVSAAEMGQKPNESGRPPREGSSQSDWEDVEEERREQRRRRRERQRDRRARSATTLGPIMREQYNIADLEMPESASSGGRRKKKEGEEAEDEAKKQHSPPIGQQMPRQLRDEAVGTEPEESMKQPQVRFDTETPALAPIAYESDVPASSRVPLDQGRQQRGGILKDTASDSAILCRPKRRPSLRLLPLNESQRRRSSTVPPSMARERRKADQLMEDAVQRMQRSQRAEQPFGVEEAAKRFREQQRVRKPPEEKRKADQLMEDAVQRMQRLGKPAETAFGVKEAAKRFREQQRMKSGEEKQQKEEGTEAVQQHVQLEHDEEQQQQLPRRRVNFLLDQQAEFGYPGPRPAQGDVQWRRNSRTRMHWGGPARQNQLAAPFDVEEGERLFPPMVKSSSNICPYCEQRDPWLENADFLRLHLAEQCPFLARCEFCDKIVEVHELNEHQLRRCPFVGDSLVDCYLCGLARYPDEPEPHPKCRFAYPPSEGAWCPLCSTLIRNADSKQDWLQHLRDECLNNLRTRRWDRRLGEYGDRPSQMLAELNENLTSSSSLPFRANRTIRHMGQSGLFDGTLTLPPIRPGGSTRSASTFSQIRALDVHHLRAAVRRLNHERRVKAIQRNVQISRRVQHDDSDSD